MNELKYRPSKFRSRQDWRDIYLAISRVDMVWRYEDMYLLEGSASECPNESALPEEDKPGKIVLDTRRILQRECKHRTSFILSEIK